MMPLRLVNLLKKPLRPVREIALRLLTRRTGVARTVNGATFRVDSRTRFAFPTNHDPEVVEAYSRKAVGGGICWNIGANVGLHVLQMARLVGPAGRVLAFEPNPEAAALLRTNVRLNGFSDRVSVAEAAIGQYPGGTDFYVSGADPMSRAQQPNPLLQRTRRIVVPVKTIDNILDECPGPPDCVLIDIEGWEIAALLGASRFLAAQPLPFLIVELHPNAWTLFGHSRQDLEALFKQYDLRLVPLSGQQDPLSEYGQVLLTR